MSYTIIPSCRPSKDCTQRSLDLQSLHKMAPKTYASNCHCGAVRYKITLEDALAPEGTTKVNRCNCSICTKYGA
jgi:hypothetical protein